MKFLLALALISSAAYADYPGTFEVDSVTLKFEKSIHRTVTYKVDGKDLEGKMAAMITGKSNHFFYKKYRSDNVMRIDLPREIVAEVHERVCNKRVKEWKNISIKDGNLSVQFSGLNKGSLPETPTHFAIHYNSIYDAAHLDGDFHSRTYTCH